MNKLVSAVTAAVAVQSIAALLWAGAAANRLAQIEEELGERPALEVRTARLEEQTSHLNAALVRIETKLDRALEEARR
ncbi:MAG: hypothetical protein V2I43_25435 [Parvularcula sp.]|jgi:hypothetical protein|nr:hypothetical protein [Parvularcula sp.]